MKGLTIFSCAICLVAAHSANALINIDLSANGDGRAYDYFSAGYAQIDKNPDGMYSTADDTQLGSDTDNFPTEGNWANAGTLSLSGTPSGSGVENFSITGATFDFNTFIDGSVTFIAGTAYSTSFDSVSGTVELTDGLVTDLNFSGNIAFTFASFPSNPYNGTLTLTESSFVLFVDETENVGFPVHFAWDFDGASTATLVPEPQTYAMAAGIAVFGLCLMRRSKTRS